MGRSRTARLDTGLRAHSPERKGWRRLVLQAYIDHSCEAETFVLAGYLSTAEEWAAFSKEWQALLDDQPVLKRFEMQEMAQSPERMERASRFYRAIERHVRIAVSCVISVDELRQAVREFNWPPYMVNVEKLEDPYFFAWKATIDMLAQEHASMDLRERVDFVFDDQAEKDAIRAHWNRYKLPIATETDQFTENDPLFCSVEDSLPLQAADFWAWWVRNWEENAILDGVARLEFSSGGSSWSGERNIPRPSMRLSKDDLKKEFARSFENISIYLASLSDQQVSSASEILEKRDQEDG